MTSADDRPWWAIPFLVLLIGGMLVVGGIGLVQIVEGNSAGYAFLGIGVLGLALLAGIVISRLTQGERGTYAVLAIACYAAAALFVVSAQRSENGWDSMYGPGATAVGLLVMALLCTLGAVRRF